MKRRLLNRLGVASIVPFLLVVVAPLTFFFGNVNEINFKLSDVVWPSLIIFSSSSIIILLLLSFLTKFQMFYHALMGLLVGIAAAIWVQSQLFVWNFGPLDGRGTDWIHWKTHMWIEGAVWVGIILTFTYLFIRQNSKILRLVLPLLFALGSMSVAMSYITIAAPTTKRVFVQNKDFDDLFRFHSKNNIIIILLDTFQSDVFDYIKKEYPDEIEFLDGFVFYRNTISRYPTTKPNIPAIRTGFTYNNEKEFATFVKDAYGKSDILKIFKKRGYLSQAAGLDGINDVVPEMLPISKVLDYYNYSGTAPWLSYLDYGLFRAAPTILKKEIYNEGNWFLAFMERGHYPPDMHGRDVRYLELFETKATIDNKLASNGTLKSFHFSLPHPPWRVDESLNYNSELGSGRKGYIRQARGALLIAERILKKLKNLNIYDSSEIVIMADHGTLSMSPMSRMTGPNSLISRVVDRVQSSSLALLLHKKPFSSGKLIIDDSPLMNSDLGCLLGVMDKNIDCKEYVAAINSKPRKRMYRFYDWKHEYWNTSYMPAMTEYIVDGHAYDVDSWRLGDYRLEPRKKIRIQNPNYILGQKVMFDENGNSNYFTRGGWSFQESSHRWTDGAKALMRFTLNHHTSSDLVLRMKASGYYAKGKIESQVAKVLVNGTEVAEWNLERKWLAGVYDAVIPNSLIGDNRVIDVLFVFSNPAAPADFGYSNGIRKLGMAAGELVIEEYHPKHTLLIPEYDTPNKQANYRLGESVSFGIDGESYKFVSSGWSFQERNHQWTDGSKASLRIKIDHIESDNFVLRLLGSAYLAQGQIDHQQINVIINKELVAEWTMRGGGWYEAPIPASLIRDDGVFNVVFEISNPASPEEFGHSSDSRKLGMAVRELVLESVQ